MVDRDNASGTAIVCSRQGLVKVSTMTQQRFMLEILRKLLRKVSISIKLLLVSLKSRIEEVV